MSRKGGYKIIDLKNYDFESTMEIKGIYEEIESNYNKTLLFTGIVINGVEKNDTFANVVVNGDGYDVTLYGRKYYISDLDIISKNVVEPFSLVSTSQHVCNFGDEYNVKFTGYENGGIFVKVPNSSISEGQFLYTTYVRSNPADEPTSCGALITFNEDGIPVLSVTRDAYITKLN